MHGHVEEVVVVAAVAVCVGGRGNVGQVGVVVGV